LRSNMIIRSLMELLCFNHVNPTKRSVGGVVFYIYKKNLKLVKMKVFVELNC